MMTLPQDPELVIFDWHNFFDKADLKEFKTELAKNLGLSLKEELMPILFECGLVPYILGIARPRHFWNSLKAKFPGKETIIEESRERFVKTLLDDEMITIAAAIHSHYKTALVATCSSDKAWAIRNQHQENLTALFDFVLFSSDIREKKWGDSFMRYFRDKFPHDPKKCIFIETSNLGLKFLKDQGYNVYHFKSSASFKKSIPELFKKVPLK